ncbi:hypothetical protein MRS44_007059 [Fusarium solani]|uniref:uncharacterized protein n=1 Tax=Fusarium solani TaxID=169388 RepID=UPI0032C40D50|nr:hypothetical protein MRS44_007059 [Fusarium solani]
MRQEQPVSRLKDNCVAGCEAKGECDPGGFGANFANHTKCPLNANKYSYCGTTKEFCGTKTVNRPSCSSKGPMRRVVGYIEGWASTRSCDKFTPSDIPDGVYTHINFAFASIDPKTFQIVPASSNDPALYRELTRKKKIDPKLKVFIAIGGWAFNDPGPTVTTFSDIARSDANQRSFIKSLISFMATYGFDGVDIDWEYPAADDRQGREEDFENLPKFLSNIKSALKQNGERNGLSIAIPASYWYLQHFDLEKISKYVDHFNSWLGNHLNSHTNLTEIKDAFDLLWRNKVNPAQVNMGLAFYARTFDVSNTGCMSPGCLFVAGGPKEPCTDAVGVMSNPEIMRKLGGKIGSGELDKTAAIKTLKFGRTWLTYDDVDTWKLKLDFARSQCLGGAMVWAISQDTPDGKFSKQLQQTTGYKSKGVTTFNNTVALGGGVFMETTESEANADVSDDQCRWTNCAQTCPSGWSAVKREDPYRKSNKELFLDGTGCGGNGIRTFCCPPGKQPFCQWLFHNNGKCTPGCPDRTGDEEMWEVASTSAACNNGKAQVACCRGNTPGLAVYRQYKWYGKEHDCAIDLGSKQCGWSSTFNMPLTSSWDGSGAQVCRDSKGKKGTRPLCENTRDATEPHFTNCDWSDDFNLGRTDIVSEGQCSSDCPSGKIKVTLDSKNNKCGKGTSAYCCDVGASYDYNDIYDDAEDLLKEFVKNPTCPKLIDLDESKLSSRSLDNITLDDIEQLSDLAKRQDLHKITPAMAAVLIVQRLMELPKDSRATRELRRLVTKYFTPIWPHLTGAYIAGRLWEFRDSISTLKAAWNFICYLDAEEKAAKDDKDGGSPSSSLFCHIPSLNTYDPGSLEDPRDQPDDTDITNVIEDIGDALGGFKWPFTEWQWSSGWVEGDGLEKRGTGAARTFRPQCPDGTTWRMMSEPYTNGDQGEALAKQNDDDKMYYVQDILKDCISATIEDDGKPDDGNKWVSEHILELQTIHMFIEYTMGVKNKLKDRTSPSGLSIKAPVKPTEFANVPCSMWKDAFMNGFLAWDAQQKESPRKTLFTLLGSKTNALHMVNAESKLNGLKAKIWDFNEPVAMTKWNKKYAGRGKTSAQHAFEQLTLVEQVFGYLMKPGVNEKLVAAYKDVKNFLDDFESLYLKQYPKTPALNLSELWTTFMRSLFTEMKGWTKTWLEHRTTKMAEAWADENTKRLNAVGFGLTPEAAYKFLVYKMEAELIWKKAQAHEAKHAYQVEKFDPEDVFK